MKADSKAAGRWDTDAGGEYFAVGGWWAMTGRGADMLIIDDLTRSRTRSPTCLWTMRGNGIPLDHGPDYRPGRGYRNRDDSLGDQGSTALVKIPKQSQRGPVGGDRVSCGF